MNTAIKLVGISKSFKGNTLFSDINLEIEQGTIVGFRGINGSGKSVLFKIIAGLYRPDSGNVFIRNERLGEKIDFPDHFGILVDSPGFIEIFSGFENLRLLAEIQNQISAQQIKEAMRGFELDPENKKPVKSYSLGMKQKLGIIQATMEGQNIVLLDEPFNALDEDSNKSLHTLIRQLKRDKITVLLTSHNQADLDDLCDIQYTVPMFSEWSNNDKD
jgi:ABC-2 type transport system ATP-binding protein